MIKNLTLQASSRSPPHVLENPDFRLTAGQSDTSSASLQLLRGRLEAALSQLDQLLIERSLLKKQVAVAEKAATEAVRFALIDELTGLANRRLLSDRFDLARNYRERNPGNMGLLFVDIDSFKCINDSYGHVVGDQLLRQVSAHLLKCARSSDTICRYGGDEFVALLPQVIDKDCVVATARRFRDQFSTRNTWNGRKIRVSVSIGISMYPSDSSELDGLIASADVAMYREKARKRGKLRLA